MHHFFVKENIYIYRNMAENIYAWTLHLSFNTISVEFIKLSIQKIQDYSA